MTTEWFQITTAISIVATFLAVKLQIQIAKNEAANRDFLKELVQYVAH